MHRQVRRSALALVAVAALLLTTAASCDHGSTKPPPPPSEDDKFRKDCLVKGGKPVIVHSNGKTTRSCIISPVG